MLRTMHHGGSVALLGIPPGDTAIDWNQVIFKGLVHQGHLRPRDVRDLVQDVGDAAERPRCRRRSSRITSRLRNYRDAFETMKTGRSGKVILDWSVTLYRPCATAHGQ